MFTEEQIKLMEGYTSIHKHSTFKQDGVATIDEHVQYAKENNVDAIFLSDHGDMSGVLDFYYKCKEAKVKPCIGCEFYYALDVNEKHIMVEEKVGGEIRLKKQTLRPFHLVLIAKNYKGYQSLVRLNNEAQRNFYSKPRIDASILKRIIAEDGNNIICSTACMKSPLYLHPDHVYELHSIFKDDLYMELQYHGYDPEKEKAYINQLIEYHKRDGIKIILTNDVHINKEEDIILHRLFTAITRGLHIESPEAAYMQGKGYHNLKGEELYSIVSEAIPDEIFFECLSNVREVVGKCNVELPFKKGHFVFPDMKIPEGFASNYDFLSHLCYTSTRYVEDSHKEQLFKELKVFKDCGFVDYILPIYDVIEWCKSTDHAVGPGRGSAAGSLINYLLYITQLDPKKYGLSFDRFITAKYDPVNDVYVNARQSAPDIDIDFEDPALVFEYVRNKYGKDKVCGIGTHLIYKAKSALREVLRAYQYLPAKINYYSKFIDDEIKSLSMFALTDEEKLDAQKPALPEELEEIEYLIPLMIRLEGRIANASRHAAGVVFSDHLQSNIPVFIDKHSLKKGKSSDHVKEDNVESAVDGDNLFIEDEDEVQYVSQYNMDSIKNTGFTKYDFLGLRTLKVLKMCQKLTGVVWNELDPRDAAYKEVYENVFAIGKTAGIFQFASGGMRNLLKTMNANCFEDIQASNALFRPQTLKQELDKAYIKNKQEGYDEDNLIHSIVKEILGESYGIPVYQEQVLRILTDLGKLEAFDADTFRKILSDNKTNTDPEQLKKLLNYKEEFMKGAEENGMVRDDAEFLYNDLASKSGYSFNKSHSCCYAYIAFCLAFFKFYYPFEFITAVMNDTPEDLLEILNDFSFMKHKPNIRIKYPNLNESKLYPTVGQDEEGKFVQLGLAFIYGLGETVAEEIINNAPYDYSTLNNVQYYLQGNDALKKWETDFKQWKVDNNSKGGAKVKNLYIVEHGAPPVVDKEIMLGDLKKCEGRKLTTKSISMLIEAGAFSYCENGREPSILEQIKHFGIVLSANKDDKAKLSRYMNVSQGVISGYILKIDEKMTSSGKPYKAVLLYNPILFKSFKVNVWSNGFQDSKDRFKAGKINSGFVSSGFELGDGVAFKVNFSPSDANFISYTSGKFLSEV